LKEVADRRGKQDKEKPKAGCEQIVQPYLHAIEHGRHHEWQAIQQGEQSEEKDANA